AAPRGHRDDPLCPSISVRPPLFRRRLGGAAPGRPPGAVPGRFPPGPHQCVAPGPADAEHDRGPGPPPPAALAHDPPPPPQHAPPPGQKTSRRSQPGANPTATVKIHATVRMVATTGDSTMPTGGFGPGPSTGTTSSTAPPGDGAGGGGGGGADTFGGGTEGGT